MTQYEQLLDEISSDGIEVLEFDFTNETFHGLYADGIIAINKQLPTNEKSVTLYEEWGHAKTNYGNILNQDKENNRKQEQMARRWGFEKYMPVEKFIEIILNNHPTDIWELIELMNVPYKYFEELIQYYKQKYGLFKEFDGGCIWFDPIDIALYK